MRGWIVKLVYNIVIHVAVVTNAVCGEPRIAECGKVSAAEIFIGEVVETGASIFEPESLICEEKEGFILPIVDFGDPDRTSKGTAEIILRIHASL